MATKLTKSQQEIKNQIDSQIRSNTQKSLPVSSSSSASGKKLSTQEAQRRINYVVNNVNTNNYVNSYVKPSVMEQIAAKKAEKAMTGKTYTQPVVNTAAQNTVNPVNSQHGGSGRKIMTKQEKEQQQKDFESHLNTNPITETEARQLAAEHPVWGAGFNVLNDFAGSVAPAVQIAADKIRGREVNTDSSLFNPIRLRDAYNAGIKDAVGGNEDTMSGKTKSFLVDTGLSMGSSLARAAALGPVAGAIQAGMGAGTSGFYEAKQKGVSDNRALLQGAAQGAAEMIFEKFSLENLESLKAVPIDSLKTMIKNTLKQSGTEASEEAFTEISNAITDALIMGDKSQWAEDYNAAIGNGSTNGQAIGYALMNTAKRVLLAGLGGALSGAGSAGAFQGLSGGLQYSAGLNSNIGTSNMTYGDIAQNTSVDPMTYRDARGNVYNDVTELAQNVKDTAAGYDQRLREGGKEVSVYEKGLLQNQMDALKGAQEILKTRGLNKQKVNLVPVSTAENDTGITQKDADNQWEALLKRPDFHSAEVSDGTTSYSINRNDDNINVTMYENGEVKAKDSFKVEDIGKGGAADIVGVMPTQSADQNVPKLQASVTYDQRLSSQESVGNYRDYLKNKRQTSEAKENRDLFKDYFKENSVSLNTKGSTNNMVTMYNGRVDMQKYLDAYKQVYNAGYNGMSVDEMTALKTNVYLTAAQRMAAFRDGMTDANLKAKIMPVYVNGEARTGGIVKGEELASNSQRKVLNWVGDRTGLRIEVVQGLKGSAEIDIDAGVMRINPYSDNFLGSVSHELTHLIKQFSNEEYTKLQKLTVEALMKSQNVDYQTLYNKYEDAYREEHTNYTTDDIIEEMVADGSTAFLNDPEFAQKVAAEDRNLAQKIADFYKGIADTLKEIMDQKSIRQVGKVMMENEKRYREAAKIWNEALQKTSERYKNGYRIETENKVKHALVFLNEEDVNDYVKTGERIQPVKNKQDALKEGKKIILTNEEEVKNFIKDSIKGKVSHIVAYAKVSQRLNDDIKKYSKGKISLENAYMELIPYDIQHAYNEHAIAKEEGDIDLSIDDFTKIADYIDTYDDFMYVRKYASGFTRFSVSKILDDGRVVIIENISKSRNAAQFKNMIGNTEEKYYTKLKNSGQIPGGVNTPDNSLPDASADINNITPEENKSNDINDNNTTKEQLDFDGAVEQTRDLIAVRNVDTSNVMSMLELEGMPSPSIAITKDKIGHVAFGDITFIFGKNTIDPQYDKRNLVFDADAWTPVYPGIEYEYDKKVLGNAKKKINEIVDTSDIPDDFKRQARGFVNNIEFGNYSLDKIVEKADNDNSLKEVFLATQGKTVQMVQEVKTKELTENEVRMSEFINNEYEKLNLDNMSRFQILDAKIEAVREGIRKYMLDTRVISEDEVNEVIDRMEKRDLAQYKKIADEYRRNGKTSTETKTDYAATNNAINSAVDTKEYHKWVKNLFEGVIANKGLNNGKDPFTASGNRKSFKQTHDPVTAENIVKAMYRGGKEQGAVMFAGYSAKSVRGAAARKYKNIDEMHQNSDRLNNISQGTLFSENEDALLEKSNNRLHVLMAEVLKNAGYEFGKSSVDSFVGAENLYTEAIISAASKQAGKDGIRKEFKKNDFDLTNEEVNELNDIFTELRNLPTDYFEAKPKRVVGWNEIKLALVPDNTDQEIIDKLKDVGVSRIEKYPAGDNDARLEMENKAEDLKFQLNIDEDPEWKYYSNMVHDSSKELRNATETLGELLSEVSYMPSEESIVRTARMLQKKTNTDYTVEKITEDLKSFFNYIAHRDNVNGSDISTIAADYAGDLLTNSKKVEYNPEQEKEYKNIRNAVKTYKFHMPEGFEGELEALGGVKNLRREFFGTLDITKEKGLALDEIYTEIAESVPGYLDPSESNPANQLENIITMLRANKPQPKMGFRSDSDFDAERYFIGQEIFQAYTNEGIAAMGSKAQYASLQREYDRQAKANAKSETEMAALQAKAAEMQARYMEQLEESKKKVSKQTMRDRVYEARVSTKTRYWKDQVLKDARDLSTWLLTPTDKKHVPDALRQPLANFLGQLDLTSRDVAPDGEPTQRSLYWLQLKETWDKIAKNGGMAEGENGTQYMVIDTDILEKMSELTDKIKDMKKLEDLDYISVLKLSDVMKAMKHSIETANEMIALGRSVTEVCNGTLDHLKSLRSREKWSGPAGKFRQLMTNDMLDAETRFHTFGKDANDVYKAVRKGFNKKVQHTAQAAQWFEVIKEKTGVDDEMINNWSKEVHVFNADNKEHEISTSQIMNLYNLLKREQSREHIHRGGIKLVGLQKNQTLRDKALGVMSDSENIKLSMQECVDLIDMLTPEQKAFADQLAYTMQRIAQWGNETSMELMGYKKFNDQHYWPIKSSRDFLHTSMDEAAGGGVIGVSVKNAGPTKNVVKKANNPITVGDVIDVWSEHVNFMANYNAFTIPLTDMVKWYNYVDRQSFMDNDGSDPGTWKTSVKQELDRTFGKESDQFIMNFIQDINGMGNQRRTIVNGLVSAFKGAAVGANLSVAIQQPTAYFRALAIMDPKYLTKAMATKSTADWDTIKKYSAMAQWKDWGFWEIDTGKSMKSILTGADTKLEALNEKQMWIAGKGDEITWKRLWVAAEQQVLDQTDLTEGTDAFYRKTAEVFDEVIDRTQVVDSVFTKSDLMRSKNDYDKMLTSFFAEPTKSYNMLYRALWDYNNAEGKEAKKAASELVGRSMTAFLLSSAAAAIAKSVITAMRDKDEDRDKAFWERWWSHTVDEFIGNINPVGYIPWIKDIYSLFSGYTSTRPDLSAAQDLVYVTNRWKKYFEGDSKYTLPNNILYTTKAISSFTGLALYGLQRDINAILDTMIEFSGNKDLNYAKSRTTYAIGNTGNTKYYMSKAMRAYRDGNTALGDKIINDMMAAGIPVEKINYYQKSELKNEEKMDEIVQQKIGNHNTDYLVDELKNMGYSEQMIEDVTKSKVNSYMKENDLSYNSLTEELDKITDYTAKGFEEFNAEYKTWSDVAKIKNGWTDKECASNFKTQVTKKFKEMYKAGDAEERSRILNILSRVKVNGSKLYEEKTIKKWSE